MYINKKKATVEIANRLFLNINKYNSASDVGKKKSRTDKHVPNPPRDVEADLGATVITFGSANFGSSYKGKLPAPTEE